MAGQQVLLVVRDRKRGVRVVDHDGRSALAQVLAILTSARRPGLLREVVAEVARHAAPRTGVRVALVVPGLKRRRRRGPDNL